MSEPIQILVVDDDPLVRDMLRDYLGGHARRGGAPGPAFRRAAHRARRLHSRPRRAHPERDLDARILSGTSTRAS